MIADCMDGKNDMVIRKSISRFARNTIDCLKFVRQLKERNIPLLVRCLPTMAGILVQNIEAAIADDNRGDLVMINSILSERQKELVKQDQAKKDYSVLADEIDRLKAKKQDMLVKKAQTEGLKKRISEMETFS